MVDGSGSVRRNHFEEVKKFIKRLNERFDIGSAKIRIALIQFGTQDKTRVEFNLGERNTLEEVNNGVDLMMYLKSETWTGDALKRSREQVFIGKLNLSKIVDEE